MKDLYFGACCPKILLQQLVQKFPEFLNCALEKRATFFNYLAEISAKESIVLEAWSPTFKRNLSGYEENQAISLPNLLNDVYIPEKRARFQSLECLYNWWVLCFFLLYGIIREVPWSPVISSMAKIWKLKIPYRFMVFGWLPLILEFLQRIT